MKQVQNDEEQLFAALKNGEAAALQSVFNKLHKQLRYFIWKIVQDEIEAEDITIDCFLQLWLSHDKIESFTHIKGFLFIAARRRSLDYLRKQKSRKRYSDHLSRTAEQEMSWIMEESEIFNDLYRVLNELPDRYKEVLFLKYFKKKKNSEVATLLGISQRNVLHYASEGIKQMKEKLNGRERFLFILFISNPLMPN